MILSSLAFAAAESGVAALVSALTVVSEVVAGASTAAESELPEVSVVSFFPLQATITKDAVIAKNTFFIV
jgi:hypothetical protein